MSIPLRLALVLILSALVLGSLAAPASAFNPLKAVCGVAKVVTVGRVDPCGGVETVGRVLKAGGKLLTGHPGAAFNALAGSSPAAVGATTLGLAAIVAWVVGGAKFALDETAKVLSSTTTPQLRSTWFSGTYWRMAGIAAVLTLPFLFAAALQAIVRGDLALLVRSALIHLPLAMLAVGIAAPLTMLVLAASDELSAIVSSAAGHQSLSLLRGASAAAGVLTLAASPFMAFLIGAFTVTAALALWIELLVREAAVYVIVLMLPLAFAAFVWPARRVWAIRTVEVLFALIMSKFAIVAVLSLGGAALSASLGTFSVVSWLGGLVLVVMAAFMPWALLRLVPLAEVASSAAGSLRHELGSASKGAGLADTAARASSEWVDTLAAHMRRQAHDVSGGGAASKGGATQADLPDDRGEATIAGASEPAGAGAGSTAEDEAAPATSEAGPAEGDVPPAEGDEPPVGGEEPPAEGEALHGASAGPAGAGQESERSRNGAARRAAASAPPGGSEVASPWAPGADAASSQPIDDGDPGLLDAEPFSREVRLGGTDESLHPRPPRVATSRPAANGRAASGTASGAASGAAAGAATAAVADDPNPLPPAQDRPDGAP